MEKKEYTYEVCPHCGEEVKLDAELKVQVCPNCKRHIVACSMCVASADSVENCCVACPLGYLADKMNEEQRFGKFKAEKNGGIMNTTNGHNKHLVELLNKCWGNKPWDVRGLIMKSLYFRDYNECVEKGIFAINDWTDWFKVDWDWEKYAYDYLMKVADNSDLKAILYFLCENPDIEK